MSQSPLHWVRELAWSVKCWQQFLLPFNSIPDMPKDSMFNIITRQDVHDPQKDHGILQQNTVDISTGKRPILWKVRHSGVITCMRSWFNGHLLHFLCPCVLETVLPDAILTEVTISSASLASHAGSQRTPFPWKYRLV